MLDLPRYVREMADLSIRLRPVRESDLDMFRRFCIEPFLIGLDWAGFRDAQEPARRFARDGYLDPDDGRLMVEVVDEQVAAGMVSYRAGLYSGMAKYWEIGIVLLPEWRGRGIGWRAQAMLCDYLFSHSPAQRIQAGTHAENIAEQKSLEKAGFRLEGVVRACEFRAGQWRDGYLLQPAAGRPGPTTSGCLGDRSGYSSGRSPRHDRPARGIVGGMTETPTYRRLYRSRDNKMLAGVCGGLANYLNIDPVAARVLFVILAAFSAGALLVAYVVMWILMPEEPAPADPWPTPTAGAPGA
jgi:phage shock protein PspC (stress-responsive transcriptional regulator)/RimJ/RimL family protein N-acetyltransferase